MTDKHCPACKGSGWHEVADEMHEKYPDALPLACGCNSMGFWGPLVIPAVAIGVVFAWIMYV